MELPPGMYNFGTSKTTIGNADWEADHRATAPRGQVRPTALPFADERGGVTGAMHLGYGIEMQVRRQIEKIAHSPVLKGSELLCEMLRFLGDHALRHPSEPVKEKLIAEQVFKRIDFAPQTDSTVRVHTGRLRSKLAEYYLTEGAEDLMLIEVPRGAYLLKWNSRAPVGPAVHSTVATPRSLNEHSREAWFKDGKPWVWSSAILACALLVVLFGRYRALHEPQLPVALARFWEDFAPVGTTGPLIEFSTPEFVGSETLGMSLESGTEDKDGAILDTWTGTGEVISVFRLTQILDGLKKFPHVKSARLLTWDEAKEQPMIFVGNPALNRPLRSFPRLRYFSFKPRGDEPRFDFGAIVNDEAKPGEEHYYFVSPNDQSANREDYALVALVPGLTATSRVLILAGITTLSTQGAAEFICREESMAQFLDRLGVKRGKRVPFFEALIAITVAGGVPIQQRIRVLRLY